MAAACAALTQRCSAPCSPPVTWHALQVFVPTPETVSLRFFLDMMLALKKPIMFVGGAGTVGVHAGHF